VQTLTDKLDLVLRVEQKGAVRHLTLHRPERRNALAPDLVRPLRPRAEAGSGMVMTSARLPRGALTAPGTPEE
jgi:hypothetical protein